jgi:uncharacterized membrane protein
LTNIIGRRCVIGISLVAIASAAQASKSYRLVDLGADYYAWQITDQGRIAGSDHQVQPTLRDGGTWQDVLRYDEQGANAIGVDAVGDVVANFYDDDLRQVAMIGYPDGNSQTVFPPFQSADWTASAISEDGFIVGDGGDEGYRSRCFTWTAGVATLLSTPGSSCFAYSVNARHQVAGETDVVAGGPFQAFIWDNGALTLLGTFGGAHSWASSINGHGHVAIGVATANGQFSGIYNGKKLLDLGNVHKSVSNQPVSMNNLDQVVGKWFAQVFGAYLYTDGRMHDLSSLVRLPAGWTLIDPQNGDGGPQSNW